MNPWVIRWRGRVWSSDLVTGAQAAIVAGLASGDTWESLNPWDGPVRLMLWIIGLQTSETGDLEGARDEVGNAPMSEILGALEVANDPAWPAPSGVPVPV